MLPPTIDAAGLSMAWRGDSAPLKGFNPVNWNG